MPTHRRIAGQVSEVVLRQVLELRPRLLRAPEFTVDQRQAGAPGRWHVCCWTKYRTAGSSSLQASLLPAQGKHLQPEHASGVFRLRLLSDAQRLLGQALCLGKAAIQQARMARNPVVMQR